MTIYINRVHRSYSTRIKDREKKTFYPNRYHLSIQRWKLRDFVIWRLYHFYDMRIPIKIPGWGRFEQFLGGRLGASIEGFLADSSNEPRWRDRLLSWTINQDMRCFQLSQKNEHIAVCDVDEETYNKLKSSRE